MISPALQKAFCRSVGRMPMLFLLAFLVLAIVVTHFLFLSPSVNQVLFPTPAYPRPFVVQKVFKETDAQFNIGCHDTEHNLNALLFLQCDERTSLPLPGDTIFAISTLSTPGMLADFDYGAFLRAKGYQLTSYVNCDDWQLHPLQLNGITRLFYTLPIRMMRLAQMARRSLVRTVKSMNLSEEETAVVQAIVIGVKDDLSPKLRKQFSDCGAAHLLAVSGLHTGIVLSLVMLLLHPLRAFQPLRRFLPFLTTLVMWFYAFVTGLEPPVVRAVWMCSLLMLTHFLQREYLAWNMVAASAFIILLFNPNQLFSVSFQFSYAAVAGILLFMPVFVSKSRQLLAHSLSNLYGLNETKLPLPERLRRKFYRFSDTLFLWIGGMAAVSIAAQAGVLPFQLHYFHSFALAFPLANILLVPLTTLIIWIAVAAIVLLPISFIGNLILYALHALLTIELALVDATASLEWSHVNAAISTTQTLFLSMSILSLAIFLRHHFAWSLVVTILALMAFSLL